MENDLDPKQASKLIKENKDLILIDVRTQGERDEVKIANSLHIDVTSPDFADNINKLDREKTYFVYCRSGNRSHFPVKLMASLGFKKVYHLKNGLNTWVEEGLPVER